MRYLTKKIFLLSLCTIFLSIFFLVSCNRKSNKQQNDNALRVYAIIHEEETKALLDLFTQKTGIKAKFMHSTTGEVINRIIAEKNNPQADVLLGGATSYHIMLDKNGALLPYKSPISKDFKPSFISPNNTWTGFCVLALGIGVNQKRYNEKFKNIPLPKSWDDLLNDAYKGEIVMTNPVASSTAYLFLQNQLQRLGKEEGWRYILKLASLVGSFQESGSAPAKLIGTGEYSLGISYIHAVSKYANEGFGVKALAVPQTVCDADCVAILRGTKHKKESEKFVDFILSPQAQELMSKISFTTPVNPNAFPPLGCVDIKSIDAIDYDTEKASLEKDDVLSIWVKAIR